jgi:hypothetical protein
MENITNTVKEKMQKVYSFTGTQLLVTWLGVVILLGIFACAGRHGGPRGMMNHDMMREQMMQMNDKRWMMNDKRQMMRRQINNPQVQPEPMVNNQDNALIVNGATTTATVSIGTGN